MKIMMKYSVLLFEATSTNRVITTIRHSNEQLIGLESPRIELKQLSLTYTTNQIDIPHWTTTVNQSELQMRS